MPMRDLPTTGEKLGTQGPVSPRRDLVKPPELSVRPEAESSFHRTMGAIRRMMPVVQKVLPLMEGNIPLVLANLLAPSPAPPVNLEPLENSLARMRTEHQELRGKIGEQAGALKRIGDQLEEAKEAAERLASEQKEVTEDLHSLRRKVGVIAWVGLGLLVVSIGLNIALFLRIERIMH
jgi:hypothetical protein